MQIMFPIECTVSGTTPDDQFAHFSNYGPCVDMLAPGQEVLSAGIHGDTDVSMKSGTSTAAPLVAGNPIYHPLTI